MSVCAPIMSIGPKFFRFLVLAIASFSWVTVSAIAQPLKLFVVQFPPFMLIDASGGFSGTALVPVALAMRRAGIPYEFVQAPFLQQLTEIKAGKNQVCAVGWYKTPEREKFALFSAPVSKDASRVGVAHAKFQVAPNATVNSVLANPNASVLMKKGFVYGAFWDDKFASMKSKRVLVTDDTSQLLLLLALGRADITFMPLEEIQYYLSTGLVKSDEINIVKFPDVPDGYARHLICSKAVDPKLIKAFDDALPAGSAKQ